MTKSQIILPPMLTEYERNRYAEIIAKKHLKPQHISYLYMLNSLISRELFFIISETEKMFKYRVHSKMTEIYNKEDWFNGIPWHKAQATLIFEAKNKLRADASTSEIIDMLSLNFWIHLIEPCYKKTIFEPVISTLFPFFPGEKPPTRVLLHDILSNCLALFRNEIAHCRIIITREKHLIRCYNTLLQAIYWMSPEHYRWIRSTVRFEEYYNILVSCPFDAEAFIYHKVSCCRKFFKRIFYAIRRIFDKNV